jgi:hypothetical protein
VSCFILLPRTFQVSIFLKQHIRQTLVHLIPEVSLQTKACWQLADVWFLNWPEWEHVLLSAHIWYELDSICLNKLPHLGFVVSLKKLLHKGSTCQLLRTFATEIWFCVWLYPIAVWFQHVWEGCQTNAKVKTINHIALNQIASDQSLYHSLQDVIYSSMTNLEVLKCDTLDKIRTENAELPSSHNLCKWGRTLTIHKPSWIKHNLHKWNYRGLENTPELKQKKTGF